MYKSSLGIGAGRGWRMTRILTSNVVSLVLVSVHCPQWKRVKQVERVWEREREKERERERERERKDDSEGREKQRLYNGAKKGHGEMKGIDEKWSKRKKWNENFGHRTIEKGKITHFRIFHWKISNRENWTNGIRFFDQGLHYNRLYYSLRLPWKIWRL